MKSFKGYLREFAIQSTSDYVFNAGSDSSALKIPISGPMFKRIWPDTIRATVFHTTDLAGIERLKKHKNISWKKGGAEKIPTPDNNFDYYCISFGLRNTKNINKSLKEAYRVLKPGGRFLCLEFSKIQNIYFNNLYKKYSKLIPHIGKIVVGEKEPYDYLIESIENFINQDELIELMQKNYFIKCEYRNLSGGMVAIHSGWKI